eukprot:3656584-Amphidinium_carterae.2
MEYYDLVRTQASSVDSVCDLALRAYVSDGALRWESRRLLPLLGFVQTSRATSPGNIFRLKRPEWSRWLRQARFDADAHIGSSKRSLSVRQRKTDDAETQNWLSSLGMLLVALGCSKTRQAREARSLSLQTLQSLLRHCTSESVCVPVDMPASILNECDDNVDDDNRCHHMQQVLGADMVDADRVVSLSLVLQHLFESVCPACKALLASLLQQAASDIHLHRDTWSAREGMNLPVLRGPSGRRRNLDAVDVETMIASGSNEHHNTKYHYSQRLAGMVNAATDMLRHDRQISVCFDAGRTGKPPNDISLAWVWGSCSQKSVLLPPVVAKK